MDGKAFLELAWARHSVRKYDARPVEPEKMAGILDAAKAAPTAANFQPQRLYVVQSAEGKERLETAMKFRFGAPVLIAVCYDKRASWKRGYDGQEFGDIDAAIVTTHMMLAAEAEGLSSVWIGSFDPEKARAALGVEEDIVPSAILAVGYEAAEGGHGAKRRGELQVSYR